MCDGVRYTRVLRHAGICIVRGHAILFKSDIFQHGPKPNGLVNLRFAVRIKVDGFGIAPSFHVEDTIRSPTVLIVANQRAVLIAAQCGLPCPGKTEKHSRLTCLIDIARTVHGKHTVLGRQHKVHHGEHALLDFSRVGGSGNQDEFLGEIHSRYVGLAAAVPLGVGLEGRRTDDRPLRGRHQDVLFIQTNEHIGHK